MERYTMFVDQKNQYCQNDSPTQGNLKIECNSYRITNGIVHIRRTTATKNLKISMETHQTLNRKSNLEKVQQNWRDQAP